MSRLFEQTLIETYSPDHHDCRMHKKQQNHLIMAVIVLRGKVIAASTNKIGTRSKGCGYSDYTIHAEKAVVKELGDLSRLKGAIMYVWRLSTKQIGLMSKPCHDCTLFLEKCMKQYGLRNVYYTHTPFEMSKL